MTSLLILCAAMFMLAGCQSDRDLSALTAGSDNTAPVAGTESDPQSAATGQPDIDTSPGTSALAASGDELARGDDEDEDTFNARVIARRPRRVAIKFRPDTPNTQRAALHAQFGHAFDHRIPQIDLDIVRVPTGQRATDVINRYRNHPRVEYAEAEVFMQPQLTPNDPWFANLQPQLQTLYCNPITGTCVSGVDAERAWDITTGSAGVRIAVIDTGCDYNHPELRPRYLAGQLTGYDFADLDIDFMDPVGHGTYVTGVIAAVANNGSGMAGTCWENPVMMLRTAFGLDGIDAIIWAADHGAKVISMSFGSYTVSAYQTACQYAFDHGVFLVGAAGNVATDQPFYPAAYPTVLAVTGVDASGQPVGYAYGNWIDVAAPAAVLTTLPYGSQLGTVGGTSMSAPVAASAAALVLSINPGLTPTQVTSILRTTADDIGAPGFDVYTGYGRVNFYRAVLAAQNTAPPPPDTIAPTASITTPASGATLSGSVSVAVQASDNVGVSRVDLYRDGTLVSGDTSAPYQWPLDTTTVPNGAHSFFARAYDAAGNVGQSAPVSVTVNNTIGDTTPPAAGITTPTSGATVTGTYTVQVSASDNVAVTSVSLRMDGTLVGTDISAPYTFSWNSTGASNGSHSLTATAIDAAGNTGTAQVTVNVSNAPAGDTLAPTIGITSPSNGAPVSGQVSVFVNTSDNVGVVRVELFVDGAFVKRSTSAPFTTRWRSNQAAPGAHTLQCRAYDAAGNVGLSAPITVYK